MPNTGIADFERMLSGVKLDKRALDFARDYPDLADHIALMDKLVAGRGGSISVEGGTDPFTLRVVLKRSYAREEIITWRVLIGGSYRESTVGALAWGDLRYQAVIGDIGQFKPVADRKAFVSRLESIAAAFFRVEADA